jgi:hypothetical protein
MSDRTTASTPVAQLMREGHKKSHPDCRWDGPHYVPPSLGDPGFYLCERGMLAPPEPTRPTASVDSARTPVPEVRDA